MRGVAAARFVGQGIKATTDEGFDPEANGLLMDGKMVGNGGDTPAGIGEANHFEAVASGGGNPSLSGALSQFVALMIS